MSTKKQLSINKINYDLDKIVKLYFDIYSIGVNTHASRNPEDDRALKILKSTSRRVDNFWEVGLLGSGTILMFQTDDHKHFDGFIY